MGERRPGAKRPEKSIRRIDFSLERPEPKAKGRDTVPLAQYLGRLERPEQMLFAKS